MPYLYKVESIGWVRCDTIDELKVLGKMNKDKSPEAAAIDITGLAEGRPLSSSATHPSSTRARERAAKAATTGTESEQFEAWSRAYWYALKMDITPQEARNLLADKRRKEPAAYTKIQEEFKVFVQWFAKKFKIKSQQLRPVCREIGTMQQAHYERFKQAFAEYNQWRTSGKR